MAEVLASSAERIKELLVTSHLAPEVVDVEDFSDGCGTKFNLTVVSAKFDGQKLLERHQAVHAALGAEMNDIHALVLKTWSPSQYAEKKGGHAR